MNDQPSRLAPLARRARCTEGQLYTMAIGLVVAVLLVSTGLPAAFRDAVRPFIGAAGADTTTSTIVEEPTPTATTSLEVLLPPSVPPSDPDRPGLAPPPGPATPVDPSDPLPEEPAPPVCRAQGTVDLAAQVLQTLRVLGVIPEPSLVQLLANLSGCKPGDPVIMVMGVLAELGAGLPDPGFDLPLLPIPGQDLPPGIVALVQPLREVIDPICGAVGSVSQLVFFGLAGWPLAIDRLTLQTLQQVLLVCGQLQASPPTTP